MAQKLEEACTSLYGKTQISLKEAIMYVNSDLISKLRYRMYLIYFPKSYLDKFETSCVRVVKRLAHLPQSLATDLLISQGLYNIHNLQNCIRAEFLQNCLQAVDYPCRLTSQISYTHLKHTTCHDVCPFSSFGLQTTTWSDQGFSPIFTGVAEHLQALDMALFINFDTQLTLHSPDISATIGPLAYMHLPDLATAGISRLHITRLFQNLSAAHITTLADLSPHFDCPISPLASPPWLRFRHRAPRTIHEILTRYSTARILHPSFNLPGASVKQRKALRILLHLLLERLLRLHASYACPAGTETSTHWGRYRKHSLNVTIAYPDGSATTDNTRAGFGIHFPENPTADIVSRIPGHQTIARAEAYGILASLLVTRLDTNLTIHSDRASLVDQINRYLLSAPRRHEIPHLSDRSLLLRILQVISRRTGTTTLVHVKAHERDTISSTTISTPLSHTQRHQECNKVADILAKSSLSMTQSTCTAPSETRFLSAVNVVLPQSVLPCSTGPGAVFENKPLKLYLRGYAAEYTLRYHLRGQWYTHLYAPGLWQTPVLSSLVSQKSTHSTKFLIQILGRTLPTFHRLHVVRARLYMDESCVLCAHGSVETIEHIFFDCPYFQQQRDLLLHDLVSLCRSRPALGRLSQGRVENEISASLLSPQNDRQRHFSAGQLPLSLFHWLSLHIKSPSLTLRLGKSIHTLLVDSYQQFWRVRCDAIKDRHLLFKDRLRAFPTLKPLHEMLEDDFIAFAVNWNALHPNPSSTLPLNGAPATCSTSACAPPLRTSVPASVSPLLAPHRFVPTPAPPASLTPCARHRSDTLQHFSSPYALLPMFITTQHPFVGQLRLSQVLGDGNCLFRALLRAHGQDDSTHLQLRHACIASILANWEAHTHALNAVHHDTPIFSITANEPFPTAAHYFTYFSTPGTFGTEVEAFVCAKLLRRPLLIWSSATCLPVHPLYNYSPTAPALSQQTLHLSYTGNHYDALLASSAAVSANLTHQAHRATLAHRAPSVTHTPPTNSTPLASHCVSRPPNSLAPTAPSTSYHDPLTRALPSPRRSFRIRSRIELRWGTTGHRTKRRRYESPPGLL